MKGTNLRTHVQLVTSLRINSPQKVAARNIYLTMSALTRSQKYWKAARTERYVLIGSWKILLWAFIFLKHYNESARTKWELKFWKNEWIKKFQNTREFTKFSPNRSQNFEFHGSLPDTEANSSISFASLRMFTSSDFSILMRSSIINSSCPLFQEFALLFLEFWFPCKNVNEGDTQLLFCEVAMM